MTTAQKIIKYLALAFAIFIIINIISGILIGLNAFSGFLGLRKEKENQNFEFQEIANIVNYNEIEKLDIELKYSELEIKHGEKLKVESNNKGIECIQNNRKISIKEKNRNWFSESDIRKIIIYIPINKIFNEIEIEAGAGKIDIEGLETDKLDYEVGAGETSIANLNVNKEADIEGGIGKLSILSGNINNLKLDMGVGEANIKSELIGKSDINAGIGEININLEDDIQNYTIKANKGLGTITIDNKDIANGSEYGNGENYIEIDGGIGNIKIK